LPTPEAGAQLETLLPQLQAPGRKLAQQIGALIQQKGAAARARTEAQCATGNRLGQYLEAAREPTNKAWALLKACSSDSMLSWLERDTVDRISADFEVHFGFLERWTKRLTNGEPPEDEDEEFGKMGRCGNGRASRRSVR
jgi:hypothetical protein